MEALTRNVGETMHFCLLCTIAQSRPAMGATSSGLRRK